MIKQLTSKKHLEGEWFKIVQEAMNFGVTKEQFKEYLEFNKWRKNGIRKLLS